MKYVRDFFRLTQQQLAEYLMIPRSQLSMDESGYRLLPPQTVKYLAPLVQVMQEAPRQKQHSSVREAVVVHEVQLQKLAEFSCMDLKFRLTAVEKKLAKMKVDQENSSRIVSVIAATDKDPDNQINWMLQDICYKMREQLDNTGVDKQLKLELQVIALQAQLEYLQTRFKKG